MQGLSLKLARGVINLAVTLIGLGLGWLVGLRLTYQWNLRAKRREFDLTAAQDLQRLYGDFFAVWKLWNNIAKDVEPSVRRELLRRSADAEGLLERLLVKLATERTLTAPDRDDLGKFRQAYQQLRRAIKASRPLEWSSSDHREYLAFKRLGVAATLIVERDEGRRQITAAEAFAALRDITSNRHEGSWVAE